MLARGIRQALQQNHKSHEQGYGSGLYRQGGEQVPLGILTGSARDLVDMRRNLSKVNDRIDAPNSHP